MCVLFEQYEEIFMPHPALETLTSLKSTLETNLAESKRYLDEGAYDAGLDAVKSALEHHFGTMGQLSRIYRGGSEEVDTLKVEIRALYEKATAQQRVCEQAIVAEEQQRMDRQQAYEQQRSEYRSQTHSISPSPRLTPALVKSMMEDAIVRAQNAAQDQDYTKAVDVLDEVLTAHAKFPNPAKQRKKNKNRKEVHALFMQADNMRTMYLEQLGEEKNMDVEKTPLMERIETAKNEACRELLALKVRVEENPDAPNKQQLLARIKNLTAIWETFAEKCSNEQQLAIMFTSLEQNTSEIIKHANQELDKMETILDAAHEEGSSFSTAEQEFLAEEAQDFDAEAAIYEECETAAEEEGFLAGIYNRIASLFNRVIELFNQYVYEPVRSAARSTASFFSRNSAHAVSKDPYMEEGYTAGASYS